MMSSSRAAVAHGVMEGRGAYNKHAKLPAVGAALAAPFLEKAVRNMALEPEDSPLVIADYGSSQGKNSLAPIRIAIRNLRLRLRSDRPICVFHIDQPSNDFNSLFEVLHSDPDRYGLDVSNVFPSAIGRSFYEQVLPPESVHLGWSSYAAVWLSRIPSLIPGHFFVIRSAGAARAAFERQAADDWERFLSLRATELRPGGRLVVVLPALNDDGELGLEQMMDHVNAVLGDMVTEGVIRSEEREQMVVGAYPRRKTELLTPFMKDGEFNGLVVEDCEMSEFPDAAWAEYQRDGDNQALAGRHAMFFRSVFMPSLASAVSRVRAGDEEAVRAFGDRLVDGLMRRLISDPTPLRSFVEIIVFAKRR